VLESVHPTSLIGHWLQELVMEGIHDGIVVAPPPVVTRCFQEFANGMVAFHDAIQIQSTSFPFPYTQLSAIMLFFHFALTPFVMCQWVVWPSWVFILTLIQVLIFWSLYFTAVEIEYPFRQGGANEESHDARRTQIRFNQQLIVLISPQTKEIPRLANGAIVDASMLHREHTRLIETASRHPEYEAINIIVDSPFRQFTRSGTRSQGSASASIDMLGTIQEERSAVGEGGTRSTNMATASSSTARARTAAPVASRTHESQRCHFQSSPLNSSSEVAKDNSFDGLRPKDVTLESRENSQAIESTSKTAFVTLVSKAGEPLASTENGSTTAEL